MSEEQVSISLVDFLPRAIDDHVKDDDENQMERTGMDLLRQKLGSNKMNKHEYSLRFEPYGEVENTSCSSEVHLSCRYDCILVSTERYLIIIDRKTKQEKFRVTVCVDYSTLLAFCIDDEHDECYLLKYDDGFCCLNVNLRKLCCSGEMDILWSSNNGYGMRMTKYQVGHSRYLILSDSRIGELLPINVADGEMCEMEELNLPSFEPSNISAIFPRTGEMIVATSANIQSFKYNSEEKQWNSLNSISIPEVTIFYSTLYEQDSDLLYFSDGGSNVLTVYKKSDLSIVKEHKFSEEHRNRGICFDYDLGELLVATSKNVLIFK